MGYSIQSLSKFKGEVKARLNESATVVVDSLAYEFESTIDEARKVVIKVNSKGKRRRKVVCGKGKRFDGTKCVVQKASEKLAKKKGMRQKKRTLKAKGAGAQRKSNKLRLKALKKRRGQGLK